MARGHHHAAFSFELYERHSERGRGDDAEVCNFAPAIRKGFDNGFRDSLARRPSITPDYYFPAVCPRERRGIPRGNIRRILIGRKPYAGEAWDNHIFYRARATTAAMIFFAPALFKTRTASRMVAPEVVTSSTSSMFLPLNSAGRSTWNAPWIFVSRNA